MKPVRIGVVGTGSISNAHMTGYSKLAEQGIVEFVAACDLNVDRAKAWAEKYGFKEVYGSHQEMLEKSDIDAVSVCTWNNGHAPITIDCLRAGKHVLCEKPPAMTVEEALEMQKVQHETGKILNIGVVNRFNDSVNLIKKYIDDGKLGDIYHVYVSSRAHRSIPGLGGALTTKAIAGGGALIDWGVHYLDIVMYCCGDPKAKTVSGEVFSKLGVDIAGYTYKDMWAGPPKLDGTYDVDDSITAMIRTDGPVITVHGAWAQNIGVAEQYIDFIGDKGGIRLQYGKDFTIYTAEHGALVEYKPQFEMRNHFQNEIDAFINCCKTGEKLPSHIDTNILTSKMMQAIYDSAEQHKEVVLE